MDALENAFRDAIRSEAAAPVASLAAALERLVRRLSGEPQFAQPERQVGAPTRLVAGGLALAPAAPSTAAEARACAVIGCRQPHRSMGYCAAHYQKRRLMVSTGRLHAAWVEDASPHTLPDVFFARKRRPIVDAPAPKPPVSPTPRMWVRKKGQAPHDAAAATPALAAGEEQQRSVALEATPPASANDKAAVSAAAQRWASDFLAQKRRPTSLAKGSHPW